MDEYIFWDRMGLKFRLHKWSTCSCWEGEHKLKKPTKWKEGKIGGNSSKYYRIKLYSVNKFWEYFPLLFAISLIFFVLWLQQNYDETYRAVTIFYFALSQATAKEESTEKLLSEGAQASTSAGDVMQRIIFLRNSIQMCARINHILNKQTTATKNGIFKSFLFLFVAVWNNEKCFLKKSQQQHSQNTCAREVQV